jgi:AcrR family transcriptional regulator
MLEVVSVRAHNMQKRRARILTEARGLLARGGFEVMNLRELARCAEVTVPTIYNLIGSKDELILALIGDVLFEIETRIQTATDADPLQRATAIVTASTSLFAEDEQFYRPAFLAVEHLAQVGPDDDRVARIYAWGHRLIDDGIRACREARLLAGRIRAEAIADLVFRSYRSNCRAWASGEISIGEFRRIALLDVHIALAADAVDPFHTRLLKKITALSAPADPGDARSRPTSGARRQQEKTK